MRICTFFLRRSFIILKGFYDFKQIYEIHVKKSFVYEELGDRAKTSKHKMHWKVPDRGQNVSCDMLK